MHYVPFNRCFAAFSATSWHLQCKFYHCHFLSTPSLMSRYPTRASPEEGRKGSGFVPAWPAPSSPTQVVCSQLGVSPAQQPPQKSQRTWIFHRLSQAESLGPLRKQAQNYTCTKYRYGSGRGCCPSALPEGEVFHHSAFITVCSCRSSQEFVCITKYHSGAALHPFLPLLFPWPARQNYNQPCLE